MLLNFIICNYGGFQKRHFVRFQDIINLNLKKRKTVEKKGEKVEDKLLNLEHYGIFDN